MRYLILSANGMKRKFIVLNTTSSVQKKEGMGESQKKALLQIDKPKRGKGVAMNNQPMPMMVNTSLIRSFYTESGMSLLRNAAFSAVRISKCMYLTSGLNLYSDNGNYRIVNTVAVTNSALSFI